MMKDYVNDELDDRNQNILNEENIIALDDEKGEQSTQIESSNSEKNDEKFSRVKGIIPNLNIDEINECD